MPSSSPTINSLEIFQEPLRNFIILFKFCPVYQVGHKYFRKLFHVLRGVDLNKTIKQAGTELGQAQLSLLVSN